VSRLLRISDFGIILKAEITRNRELVKVLKKRVPYSFGVAYFVVSSLLKISVPVRCRCG